MEQLKDELKALQERIAELKKQTYRKEVISGKPIVLEEPKQEHKGAGRPRNSFKYNIPIRDYQKLRSRIKALWKVRSDLLKEAVRALDDVSLIENAVRKHSNSNSKMNINNLDKGEK